VLLRRRIRLLCDSTCLEVLHEGVDVLSLLLDIAAKSNCVDGGRKELADSETHDLVRHVTLFNRRQENWLQHIIHNYIHLGLILSALFTHLVCLTHR